MCIYSKVTKRLYDMDGSFHIDHCPTRARHYNELALDRAEEERRQRFGEYNRRGTENMDGYRLTVGMSLKEEEDETTEEDE